MYASGCLQCTTQYVNRSNFYVRILPKRNETNDSPTTHFVGATCGDVRSMSVKRMRESTVLESVGAQEAHVYERSTMKVIEVLLSRAIFGRHSPSQRTRGAECVSTIALASLASLPAMLSADTCARSQIESDRLASSRSVSTPQSSGAARIQTSSKPRRSRLGAPIEAPPCGSMGPCPTGLTCCGDRCVGRLNDPHNCGSCNIECRGDRPHCVGGHCVARPCGARCGRPEACCGAQCCGEGQLCCQRVGGSSKAVCSEPVKGTCPVGCPQCQ
jgi:hypothetical protein